MRAALLIAAAAATASGPFDGRWSGQPEFCDRPQDDLSAPALIRPGRLDEHAAHCRWGLPASAGAGAWTAKGSCSIEGDASKGGFRFSRRGNALSIRLPNGVTTRYRLCPAP